MIMGGSPIATYQGLNENKKLLDTKYKKTGNGARDDKPITFHKEERINEGSEGLDKKS